LNRCWITGRSNRRQSGWARRWLTGRCCRGQSGWAR
jgi:hypothetical protein